MFMRSGNKHIKEIGLFLFFCHYDCVMGCVPNLNLWAYILKYFLV